MFRSLVSKLLCHFAILGLIFNPTIALAQALPITPDGTTSTSITQTASGIDQVNIATPNSSGLSHNNFTDYNINQNGQVINNFSGQVASEVAGGSGTSAVTSTQIGGLVTVNQNLSNSGSARIILNEVTSGNNTQLLGYGEIAGTKAELIIANPNGITCSGCGFINTSRLSLVAGSSNFDQNNNLGFNVSGQPQGLPLQIPLITISGLGLDVERTSYTDIIASSIKLIGNIYGSDDTDVTLKTGEGSYNYNTKQLTTDDRQLSTNVELFAVDASNLGSIQSGRIFIIATKDGFGVNLNNSLIASKELNIDSKGNLYYANISSPTITINSTKNITQKADSTTLANSIDITATKDFTINSNALLKSLTTDININAQNFTNLGNILSSNNLNITTTKNLTNSGILNAVNIITLNVAEDIANNQSGIIGSFSIQNDDGSTQSFNTSEVSITSKNLNNKNLISADTLRQAQSDKIINSGTIYSKTNLDLTAANIANSSVIYAKNNLTISAPIITNSNYLIAELGDLKITTNNLNNNNGLIQAAQNLSIKNISQVENFSNISGQILSGTAIDINLGANNYTINGVVSSKDIKITASNIINQASVEAASSITLNSNSIVSEENSKFIAGSFLTATAANNIDNYGLFSATTDLTLNATDLNNFDRILAGNNITTNISNNFTNKSSALFGAGNNLNLNVNNNFLNDRAATILAIKNITIKSANAGSDNLYKLNNFTNNSALLESIEGSIYINAKDFYNKRDAQDLKVVDIVKTDANKVWYEDKEIFDERGTYSRVGNGWWGLTLMVFNLVGTYRSKYVYLISDGPVQDSFIEKTITIRRQADPNNKNSSITAAGDVLINSNNFTNSNSQIIALNDLAVTTNVFNNRSTTINNLVRHTCGAQGGGNCSVYYNPNFPSDSWDGWWGDYITNFGFGGYNEFEVASAFITASLKASRNLVIKASDKISNGDQAQGDEIQDPTLTTTHSDFTSDDAYVAPTIAELKDAQTINITPAINSLIPLSNSGGLFAKNTNPNQPLYETRAEFIDQSKFLGSDYFFNVIGYHPPAASKLIGDNFFTQKLIEAQLDAINKTSATLSSSSYALYSDNIKELMDNAAQMKQDLQLTPGITLSAESVAKLTKDIVWMEPVNIKDPKTGAITTVLAPKVYLAKSTIDKLKTNDGEILAANNITISGDSAKTILNNSGSIIASNNLLISDISILNNQGRNSSNRNSLLEAGNNLTVTLNSNLLNLGTIKTTGTNSNLTLTSLNGNITNANFSTISSANNLTLTSLSSNITNANFSTITAGNNLTLNALNGTLLNKSKIEANNNLAINARDIKNISTVETNDANLLASNSDAYQLKFGDSSRSSGNISSSLLETASLKGGSININAQNDFTNLAANISTTKNILSDGSTTSGNIAITAGDDINISTLELRNRTETSWGSGRRRGTNITDTTTNIQSNIDSAGSISLVSYGNAPQNSDLTNADYRSDIKITGSNLTAQNNITLQAKDDITIQSAENSSYSFSAGKSGKGKSFQETTSSTTQVSSNLTTTNNGNIIIQSGVGNTDQVGQENSAGSIAIIASNLKTSDLDNDSTNNLGSGNINLTAKEDIVIASALNTSFHESISSKKGSTVKKTSLSIDADGTNIASNISASGDFSSTSGSNTTIIASNLNGNGSANIIAGKYLDSNGDEVLNNDAQVNIFNAVDTHYSYQNTFKEKTGFLNKIPIMAPGIQLINSALLSGFTYRALDAGTSGGYSNATNNYKNRVDAVSNGEKIVATNLNFQNNLTITSLNDLNVRSSNLKTAEGDLSLASGNDINITSVQANNSSSRTESGKSTRQNNKSTIDTRETATTSSIIESGDNLTLTSLNDTILQATKLNSKNDLTINAGNNLLLLTAVDLASKTESNRSIGTYWESIGNSGYFSTNTINNQIASNDNSNSGLSINVGNQIFAQYKNTESETTNIQDFKNNPSLAYLSYLDPEKTTLIKLDDVNLGWSHTNRNLTDTGTAVAIVGITAATIATGGGAAGAAGSAVGGGTAGAAAAGMTMAAMQTIANQFILTSINNGGNVGRAASSLTDKEFLQTLAINMIAAGIGAGVAEYSGLNNAQNLNGLSATERTTQNFSTGFQRAGINATAYSVANSAVTGESLSDSLKQQDLKLILTQALAETGAKEIGYQYHGQTDAQGNVIHNISKPTQLALHGVLGASIAAAQGNNNASGILSGAAAGAIGELAADNAFTNGVNASNSILIGQTSGSLASLFTSLLTGASDEETARNINTGNFIATNAVINNTMLTPDIGTPQPGIDDEDLEQVEETRIKVAKVTADAAYEVSPMGVNRTIEEMRGSEQSWNVGKPSVYKGGDEWNGVYDPKANNIGIGNITSDPFLIGTPVKFDFKNNKNLTPVLLNEGGVISQICNYQVPGCNDMSLTHDYLAGQWNKQYPQIPGIISNQLSIPFAYIYNTYGLIGKPINKTYDKLTEKIQSTKAND